LPVSMGLIRTVRRVAHRLRGVKRLRMLYLQGRQFQIAVGPRPSDSGSASIPSKEREVELQAEERPEA
jgi:hypothetical protein